MIGIFLVSLFFGFLFYELYWKRRNYPPGPTPIPLIGNVLTIGMHEPGYEPFNFWTKAFGPVYTIWFANKPVVVIADYEVIKDTVIKDGNSYAGRPAIPISRHIRGGNFGVVELSGDPWVHMRRFVIHQLKNFGMGSANMEARVISEVAVFVKAVSKKCSSGPVDIQSSLDEAVGSIINTMLFGHRYDESNVEDFHRLKKILDNHMELASKPEMGLLAFNIWVKALPHFNKCYDVIMHSRDNLFGSFRHQIEEHKKEIDFDSETSKDIVEAFLKEYELRKDEPENGGFSMPQLESLCFDIWIAGMETTSNTLYWSILYVLRDQQVQKKIHAELDSVVGSDRLVVSEDKNSLHYLNAVIQEAQRLANLLPMNLMHETTQDVVICGHPVKKGTILIPQISAVLYDEKLFPEPYRFNPDRFIKNGEFQRCEEVIPFGVGKRACLGEGLARLELYLFLANFFNAFKISAIDENNLPSIYKKFGTTMRALNYSMNIEKRY